MAKRNLYTRDEIILCIYAALFDASDFGGIEAIHSLNLRSRASIEMKIQNIVAMCDEEGLKRNPDHNPLSGRPNGQTGRRTNWNELQECSLVSQDSLLAECRKIIEDD